MMTGSCTLRSPESLSRSGSVAAVGQVVLRQPEPMSSGSASEAIAQIPVDWTVVFIGNYSADINRLRVFQKVFFFAFADASVVIRQDETLSHMGQKLGLMNRQIDRKSTRLNSSHAN